MHPSRSLSSSRATAKAPPPHSGRLLTAPAALLSLGALLALTAPRLHAQTAVKSPAARMSLTPYAGYFLAGHFYDGPLGTSIGGSGSPIYGAQLTVPITSTIAVIGNAGYASGDLKIGVPFLSGIDVGSVKSVLYDAGLELRSPTPLGAGASIVPFVQGGVGGIRRDVSVSGVTTQATGLAWNAGLGADMAFGPNVGLRVLAKDYIGKFDFQEATGLNINGTTAQNWAVTAGLRLAF